MIHRVEVVSVDKIRDIVRGVEFRDYRFIVTQITEGEATLQIRVPSRTGDQMGRKWLLDRYMTRSEILRTCLLAIITFQEHEVREEFLYFGEKVFNPHTPVAVSSSRIP